MPTRPLTDHPRFEPLSAEHLAVLLLIAVAVTAGSILLRRIATARREPALRRSICWGLAAVMVGTALAGQAYRIRTGTWSLRESLPLHLCDLALLSSVVALLGIGSLHQRPTYFREGKRWSVLPANAGMWQRLYELAFVWGLGGTLQAVLTPDNEYGFPHFHFFRYFITHSTIVIAALVLTFGLRMRLLPGTVGRVWVVTLAAAIAVLGVNTVLGSNYMYLCGPPNRPSIIDFLGPWPYSLLPLAALGTVLIVLCYLPFWFLNRAAEHRESQGRSG